jgi:hypothetical protein
MSFKLINLPRNYKIPDKYRTIIYTGYLSIILLFLSFFFDLTFSLIYGTLNGNIGGSLGSITLIFGAVLFIYSILRLALIIRNMKNKSQLSVHYNLLFGVFVVYIVLSIVLTNLKVI